MPDNCQHSLDCPDWPDWPNWLAEKCLPDSLLSDAYVKTAPQLRAALKTGLALASFHFGDSANITNIHRAAPHLGFQGKIQSRPVDWALITIHNNSCPPARLCAALALPLLSGVPKIVAAYVDQEPTEAQLVAMELCALGDIFSLAANDLPKLFAFLGKQGQGRMLSFSDSRAACPEAEQYHIPYMNIGGQPDLLLLDPKAFDLDTLQFLHGAPIATDARLSQKWDCIFSASPNENLESRLTLAPGCEGFWLFENLAPDFFKARSGFFSFLNI